MRVFNHYVELSWAGSMSPIPRCHGSLAYPEGVKPPPHQTFEFF